MTRSNRVYVLAVLVVLAAPCHAGSQERFDRLTSPTSATKAAQASKSTPSKLKAVTTSLNQRVEAALAAEPALKASFQADLKAAKAEKDPKRKANLLAGLRTKYQSDQQRLQSRAGIDLSAIARDLQTTRPSMSFKVTNGNQIVGRTSQAQSQPATSPTPTPLDVVKELVGPDYTFSAESNCAPGEGQTTRSGGFVTSVSEDCDTEGSLYYQLEVPAGKQARVEMSANLEIDAHSISTYAWAWSEIAIDRGDGSPWLYEAVSAMTYSLFGDDANERLDGASIIRTLGAGSYRLRATTSSDSDATMPLGWAAATARVKTLRVKITLSPK